jgi:DNA recombination-dependent growth factor C
LHNKLDFSSKQQKTPTILDTSKNLIRLDEAKYKETSEAIKKLLEPINNKI